MAGRGRRRLGRERGRPALHDLLILPGAARSRRIVAAAAALLLLGLQVLVAGPAAALPQNAYWYGQWDLQNTWKITKGAGVTVAVVDSGVDADLGDLRGQVLSGLNLSGAAGGADSDNPLPGNGDFGHGSAMAALIAGTGKGAGMVGVAPSTKILPIRVGDGRGAGATDSQIAEGVRYAVDHGAQVVNLSLGSAGSCAALPGAAIKYAYQHDVIVVASAGDSPGQVASPATCPGALGIGGVDATFTPWPETPTGSAVSFVAPSVNIPNELLNNTLSPANVGNAGTSQAAALVSGVFALIRAKFPSESAREIVTRALYAVHNGLGTGHLSQRINDRLGYGEVLPKLALTQTLPANAKNPIYDSFAAALGSSTPSSGSSTTPAASTPASSSTPAADSDAGASSGTPTWQIVLVIAVVVVLIVLAAVALGRRRSRRPPQGPQAR